MFSRKILFLVLFLGVIAFPGCQKVEDSYISGTEQMLADELYREGKYEKAIKLYEKAINEDADGILYLKLGKAYEMVGQPEKAKASFLKAEERANFLKEEVAKKLESMDQPVQEVQQPQEIQEQQAQTKD